MYVLNKVHASIDMRPSLWLIYGIKGSFILERKQMRKRFFSLMFAVTAVAVV